MSKIHKGVLRAVRLLPDVVKIGVVPETALPSDQREEQLLRDGNLSEVPETKKEINHTSAAEPLRELQSLIAALEVQLNEAKAKERDFTGKVSSLEAELAAVKNASVQKEREMTASIDAVKKQAHAEGMSAGQAEGLQKGYDEGLINAQTEVEQQYREKFSSLAEALEGISAKLEADFAELAALNQPRMLRLWQSMLKKMLFHEMTMTPDGIFKVLADVLSRISDKNHVLIYVSPDDVGLLDDKLEGKFGEILRGVKHLELKPDAHVDKGSCLVETNLGVYDARWRTQFEQIDAVFESLFQKLGKAPQAQAKVKESRAQRGGVQKGSARSSRAKPEVPEKENV